jgi:hypothetical protein
MYLRAEKIIYFFYFKVFLICLSVNENTNNKRVDSKQKLCNPTIVMDSKDAQPLHGFLPIRYMLPEGGMHDHFPSALPAAPLSNAPYQNQIDYVAAASLRNILSYFMHV